ncbi:MAG: hypothetical protein IIA61_05035 [Candidatus Marinimicrobia bacterium]|nr:hypothetical protein [Candidatus Neomarinimicrobiota bacterium]
MQFVIIMINNKPFCFWDWNIKKKNEEFISEYDPLYFDTIASMLHHHLEDEKTTKKQKQYISFALRSYLSHAAESLFALLGATLQAPDCIYGWLFKYRNSDLNSLIDNISKGARIRNKLRLSYVDWESLSNTIHQFELEDQEKNNKIKRHFADFWQRLSSEYRSKDFENIYNSIKHGYRARPGGVFISFGLEKTHGKPATPNDMKSLGGSEYGATYFFEEFPTNSNHNIRLHEKTINWLPKNIWYQIGLIRLSLSNIISFLKLYHNQDPETAQYAWPENLEDFEFDLRNTTGTLGFTMNIEVKKSDIRDISKEEITQLYDKHYMVE